MRMNTNIKDASPAETDAEYARKLYNEAGKPWPDDDPWHTRTHAFIQKYVTDALSDLCRPGSRILNAGAGDSTYPLDGHFYNCDVAEKLIAGAENPIVASVECLPCEDAYFDCAICVGSVLNYCRAEKAVPELARTLKQGGILVLHFERSHSAEFLFTRDYGKKTFIASYPYNGNDHRLHMYDENHIAGLLKDAACAVIRKKRFHSFSALVYRFNRRAEAGRHMDKDWLARPADYWLASDVVFVCQKITRR